MSPGSSQYGVMGQADGGCSGMWETPLAGGMRSGYLSVTLSRLYLVMIAMVEGLTAQA